MLTILLTAMPLACPPFSGFMVTNCPCSPARRGRSPVHQPPHLVPSPHHTPQIHPQLLYWGQPSEESSTRLPGGPEGVALGQGPATQGGVTEAAPSVPWSIPNPEDHQPNCSPAPTTQGHESISHVPCLQNKERAHCSRLNLLLLLHVSSSVVWSTLSNVCSGPDEEAEESSP